MAREKKPPVEKKPPNREEKGRRRAVNLTPKKRRRGAGEWRPLFLASLREDGCVRYACTAAKISRVTAYEHKETDPEFAGQWEISLQEAIESLEREAARRAKKSSDVLLIFLLKAHRPEKYRDKVALSDAVNAEIERRLAALAPQRQAEVITESAGDSVH